MTKKRATGDSAKFVQVSAAAAAYMHGMLNTRIALVTGANKGIGLEIAKGLASRGVTVFLGARDVAAGAAAARSFDGGRALHLDVCDRASIDAAAERIRTEVGRLDILVNNAGISNVKPAHVPLAEIQSAYRGSVVVIDEVRRIYETNVFGVIAVTQAMLPLLRESPAGRIVNVSSALGSLSIVGNRSSPYRSANVAYPSSKSALNAVTVAFATELEGTRIKVNAACPGHTATDLNRFSGQRTVQQAAREPVRLALLDDDGPTGTFSNEEGPLPW